jgi:hypothetical protein
VEAQTLKRMDRSAQGATNADDAGTRARNRLRIGWPGLRQGKGHEDKALFEEKLIYKALNFVFEIFIIHTSRLWSVPRP